MGNFDFKLGEWFKKVEKSEKELKAKKTGSSSIHEDENEFLQEEKPRQDVNTNVQPERQQTAKAEEKAKKVPYSSIATADEDIVAPAPKTPSAGTADQQDTEFPPLFEKQESEQLDDFLSFLSRASNRGASPTVERSEPEPEPQVDQFTSETVSEPYVKQPEVKEFYVDEPVEEMAEDEAEAEAEVEDLVLELDRGTTPQVEEEVVYEEKIYETPKDQGLLNLSEGTGTPRPISRRPDTDKPKTAEPVHSEKRVEVQMQAEVAETEKTEPKQEAAPATTENDEFVEVAPVSETHPTASAQTTQDKWDRMPAHLQILFGLEGEEVAQNSYKKFKETRSELIQRLLDPVISLEEAARILNVCPTTVRRYTNRGVLKHHRTAGNQRRFRLSDVLSFMESNSRNGGSMSGEE